MTEESRASSKSINSGIKNRMSSLSFFSPQENKRRVTLYINPKRTFGLCEVNMASLVAAQAAVRKPQAVCLTLTNLQEKYYGRKEKTSC